MFYKYEQLAGKAKHRHQTTADEPVFWLVLRLQGWRWFWIYWGGLESSTSGKVGPHKIYNELIKWQRLGKRPEKTITKITPTYKEPHAGKICLLRLTHRRCRNLSEPLKYEWLRVNRLQLLLLFTVTYTVYLTVKLTTSLLTCFLYFFFAVHCHSLRLLLQLP